MTKYEEQKQDKQTMEEIKRQVYLLLYDKSRVDVIRYCNEDEWPIDEIANLISTIRREAYLQGAKDAIEAVKVNIESQTVYLRSKFSRDYSRGESELEKNTEMIDRNQTLEILSSQAQQFIDSLKEANNED